jgi:hypothetical protein
MESEKVPASFEIAETCCPGERRVTCAQLGGSSVPAVELTALSFADTQSGSRGRRSRVGIGHPPDTLPCRLLFAVVRPQISSPPSADSATATTLDVAQNFFGLEVVNRQRALMVARPIAFALAEAIDSNWRTP